MWTYLEGYRAGAHRLQRELKGCGWAMAKGYLKCRISWYVQTCAAVKDPFTQGFIDAQLDSIN